MRRCSPLGTHHYTGVRSRHGSCARSTAALFQWRAAHWGQPGLQGSPFSTISHAGGAPVSRSSLLSRLRTSFARVRGGRLGRSHHGAGTKSLSPGHRAMAMAGMDSRYVRAQSSPSGPISDPCQAWRDSLVVSSITCLVMVYSSIDSSAISLPKPLCFSPPCGNSESSGR